MDIEKLKEAKKCFEETICFMHDNHIYSPLYDLILELIDEAIAAQSVTSEDVQRAIKWAEQNISELVKQLKDLAETKERYDYQIKKGEPWKWEWEKSWRALAVEQFQTEKKSAELAITALRQYQKPTDGGRFPDEAESEYRKNFEAKCKKTGINLLAEPTDEAVQRAIKTVEGIAICASDKQQRTDARLAITALQAYQPWVSVEDEKPESGKHVLLCCEVRPSGKRYVCDGYYAKPKSIIGGDDGECSTEYDEETDEYYLLEGYYEVIKNWEDYSSIAIDDFVVAWKSLPEPPKGE